MMSKMLSLNWAPSLEDAIDRHPLIVIPTMPLLEAITLISQAHRQTCTLTDDSLPEHPEARSSCLLVMQGKELLGILTERDVVRLTAQAINFSEVTVAEVMIHPVITLPQKSAQDIFAALFLLRRYRIRHLPIVDHQEHLVGVISHESIRQILRPANLLRLRRVADVMTSQVIHAPLDTTVLELAQLMAEHRVSCVVITQLDAEWNDQPIGIVTEHDIVQFQALQINFSTTQAATIMSTPLVLLSPNDSLWTAHQEMQKKRVGRLVVSWNWGQGLGIITQTSLLRVFDPMEMYGVIENLQQTIQQLLEAKQTSSQGSISLDSLPIDSLPIAMNYDRHLQRLHGDRNRLLAMLETASQEVQRLLNNLDLSIEQQRSRLQVVLDLHEKLKREVRSSKLV